MGFVRPTAGLAVLLVSTLAACGSSDDGGSGTTAGTGATGGSATTTCVTEDECEPIDCRCVSGIQHNNEAKCEDGACVPAEALCEENCANYGGLEGFGPGGTVEDSPACSAFCDKILAACPAVDCDKSFQCDWHYGECAAGKIKELECHTEQAEIECLPDGWSATFGSCQGARAFCE